MTFCLFLALGNFGQRNAGPKLLTECVFNDVTAKEAVPSSEDTLFFRYIVLSYESYRIKAESRNHSGDCRVKMRMAGAPCRLRIAGLDRGARSSVWGA